MTERTRRATEAVEAHYEYWEACRPGSYKSEFEDALLDVTRSPKDPRYGHEAFLYAPAGTFQGWLKHIVGEAETFTATTELWREVQLTLEMLYEEGIDWVPLKEYNVPVSSGFFLAPYGIEVPKDCWTDLGLTRTPRKVINGKWQVEHVVDNGGGDRWFIDGFLWSRSNIVASDGIAGPPTPGLSIFPLTRWRPGHDGDRPFRLARSVRPDRTPPPLVASDHTGWKFDGEGETEWADMNFIPDEMDRQMWLERRAGLQSELPDDVLDEITASTYAFRRFLRLLVWSTFKWMTDEIQLNERAERPTERRAKERPNFSRPRDDGSIVIFDLRKESKEEVERSEASGEPRWWRTRWKVRRHKARRRVSIRDAAGVPVGPRNGPDAQLGVTFEYRWVEIQEFEKGPRNAPLVFKDKVGVINR